MHRSEQLNDIIKNGLAEVIIGEVESPNFLITISRVSCSSDLAVAKVFVSILPENFSGTALKKLRNKSGVLARLLKNKTKVIKVPRLVWFIDEDLKKIAEFDRAMDEIREEGF